MGLRCPRWPHRAGQHPPLGRSAAMRSPVALGPDRAGPALHRLAVLWNQWWPAELTTQESGVLGWSAAGVHGEDRLCGSLGRFSVPQGSACNPSPWGYAARSRGGCRDVGARTNHSSPKRSGRARRHGLLLASIEAGTSGAWWSPAARPWLTPACMRRSRSSARRRVVGQPTTTWIWCLISSAIRAWSPVAGTRQSVSISRS